MKNNQQYVLENLAYNLKTEREKQKISQEELSFRSDLHKNYISDIELAKRNPSIKSLLKLANGLEIDWLDLLKET
ncbi:transcriptional regulator [Williamsoniiplasma luminosum]|uniref:Transcriptional regulator n=1 Tax=Williamsoniiplasma luminosum TaxID=214888 RepID=A0A2K8NVY0_9MOLU|nr:helix-turn-helix transcriptional regulator [Williamsoniiplasma luminosum]ATZ16793.1 transcriptional regulator [Williamsoniiplasma luminosum]AVP49473.1 MAG: XRE family transcriptional regulator [Williamsoniiplasma luminosum]